MRPFRSVLFFTGLVYVLSGFLLLIFDGIFQPTNPTLSIIFSSPWSVIIGIFLILLGIIGMWRPFFRSFQISEFNEALSFSSRNAKQEEITDRAIQQFRSETRELRKAIGGIQNDVEELKGLESVTQNADRYEEFRQDLIASLSVSDFVKTNRQDLLSEMSLGNFREELERIRTNLTDFRQSLRGQYVTTLMIGGALGISPIGIALYLLAGGYNSNFVNAGGQVLWTNILGFYVPWITIIIVIEFLAVFFLRLYKNTIETDRYLRNEISSLGLKMAGAELALMMGDKSGIRRISDELLKLDRHQILNKDQTTIEIEKSRFDNENFKDSVNFLSSLWPKIDTSALNSKDTDSNNPAKPPK